MGVPVTEKSRGPAEYVTGGGKIRSTGYRNPGVPSEYVTGGGVIRAEGYRKEPGSHRICNRRDSEFGI